jgi:prefoldin subunit 5
MSIADLFAARLAELEARSRETDRSIARHLERAQQLIREAQAIDERFPADD